MPQFPLASTAADPTATSTLLLQGGLGAFMVVFSATMAWLIVSWPIRPRRIRRSGVAVPGTLEASVGSRSKSVRVRFHTREGREVSVRQNLFTPTRIRTREVTVYYDPQDPRRAHAIGVRDRLPPSAYLMVAICLLFFLLGLGLVGLSVYLALAPG